MKIKNYFLTAMVLLVAMSSCSEDNGLDVLTGNQITFSSSIASQTITTRAANNAWDPNDAIGVFMKTGTGLGSIVNGSENKKHITTLGDGLFIAASEADAVYFPATGTVDFIAYYPHTPALVNTIYKVDVSDQSAQEKIDLLYSNNMTGKKKDDAVLLNFKHELSKVVFNVQAEAPVTSLADFSISISDMYTTGDYDLADQTLTETATTSAIVMKTTANALTAVSEGIVLPTTALGTRKFTFTWTVGGETKTFEWDASAQVFAKGKKNIYTVKLAEVGVLITPTATIDDWGAGSSEDIDVPATGDAGDGSLTKPYSVDEAATKIGETEKWLEGFIVGSTLTPRSIGTPSKTNILLAKSADETDPAKCIVIDLQGSVVQSELDIVTYPALIGGKVKVKGDIVQNIFGNSLTLTNVTNQEGGAEVPMITKEFFSETFGSIDDITESSIITSGNGYKEVKLSAFQHFNMKSPVVYTAGTINGLSLRHIEAKPEDGLTAWFPTRAEIDGKDRSLVIGGIESNGYTELELSYDFLAGIATITYNTLILRCNDVEVILPTEEVGVKEAFKNVKISIPNGTTKIELVHNKASGHMRLDNIKIQGKTKEIN